MMKISAVINTFNEQAHIEKCLKSLNEFVDEIILVDMHSTDDTINIAKKYTKYIFEFKKLNYVEPARNFAIDKASGDWILVIDADEYLPVSLGSQLKRLSRSSNSYYRFPHKNIIFGSWMRHSGWWPDYHIRFFRKGTVNWTNEIHSIPITTGQGADLEASENNALIHNSYNSIEQFLNRLNRYTNQEVIELKQKNEKFKWENLIIKPGNEFLRRYFVWEGYKDGLHGLILATLQAVSFFIVQLKLWEQFGFQKENVQLHQSYFVIRKIWSEFNYWYHIKESAIQTGIKKYSHMLRAKIGL